MKTRIAKIEDFKKGNNLITSEGFEFTLTSKYANGIWEARSKSGSICIFENEAKFYKVIIK